MYISAPVTQADISFRSEQGVRQEQQELAYEPMSTHSVCVVNTCINTWTHVL